MLKETTGAFNGARAHDWHVSTDHESDALPTALLYLLYIYFKSIFVIYRYIIYVPLIENIFMKIMFEYLCFWLCIYDLTQLKRHTKKENDKCTNGSIGICVKALHIAITQSSLYLVLVSLSWFVYDIYIWNKGHTLIYKECQWHNYYITCPNLSSMYQIHEWFRNPLVLGR